MLLKKNETKKKRWALAFVLFGIIILGFLIFGTPLKMDQPSEKKKAETNGKQNDIQKEIPSAGDGSVQGEIIVLPAIDYQNLEKDKELKDLMESRKDSLGIKKSLDMIVHSDEDMKIGDVKISMRDILEKAFLNEGAVFEEKIDASGAVIPPRIKAYGIYVVQPGDNIWNIHFNILKDYYESRGIIVSPRADEPMDKGQSSGVGKILKFSETMVIIYNLLEKKVDVDINLLSPLSKIIVYNMDEVFSLLRDINFDTIDRIQFDGKTIWVPAKKS
ncbi:MAG: hypothetical protein A3J85_03960 [Desulfobacula sp. RIFOXYA12_FULL_46_16]|nr:MAG: hypothetical protein A2464_06150 [Deltaproteobacteria bacterium RIFOXYC2_FULL_48_10]OGR20850.1 MAG: hypothetical protein A3J85_03960 [Desulfobacula sp. RIFOXYA12_FULL_46_16]OGR35457.1 MAG: hypothetical protein A3J80_11270 [Desulfobacula sp. RIFOXYB2_FULL_45_6]